MTEYWKSSANGRVVVPTFDQNQIKNICDVRLMIEKHAIEHYLSAAADVSSLLDQLEICAKKCEEYLDKGISWSCPRQT